MIPRPDEPKRGGRETRDAATRRGLVTDADRPGAAAGTAGDLSKEEIFDALRNGRRRAAIRHLRRHGGEMSVSELATGVAAEEYDVAPEDLSSKQYKRVYTGLAQCHLQRADDLGIAEFDTDENTVRLTSRVSSLDPFLNSGETPGRPGVKLGVAIGVALGVAIGLIGMDLFGIGSPTALATLPVGGLLGIALSQF